MQTSTPGSDSRDGSQSVRSVATQKHQGRCDGGRTSCCGPAEPHRLGWATWMPTWLQFPMVPTSGRAGATRRRLPPSKSGERVLDLSSGGGFDAFLAAAQVGLTGQVIGVGMTPEMIALAKRERSESRPDPRRLPSGPST